MDTISHATHGAIMYRPIHLLLNIAIPEIPTYVHIQMYILFATIGAMPDIIGYVGLLLNSSWGYYLSAHSNKKNILYYIPMSWLHIYLDSFTHGDNNRWWIKGEKLSWEIWNWVITIILIIILWVIC